MDRIDPCHLDHLEDEHPTPVPYWEQAYMAHLARRATTPWAERVANAVVLGLLATLLLSLIGSAI